MAGNAARHIVYLVLCHAQELLDGDHLTTMQDNSFKVTLERTEDKVKIVLKDKTVNT